MKCLFYHKYVHIKTVSLVGYIDLAMGSTVSELSGQDLSKLMGAIIEFVPNSRREDVGVDLFQGLSEHMAKHVAWVKNIQMTILQLRDTRNNCSYYEDNKKKRIDGEIANLQAVINNFFMLWILDFVRGARQHLIRVIPLEIFCRKLLRTCEQSKIMKKPGSSVFDTKTIDPVLYSGRRANFLKKTY